MQSGTDHQKGQTRTQLAQDVETVRGISQQQQGERHDREAAELQHAAEPDIGNATQTERRMVIVRAVPDQCTEGRENQRQGEHGRH